MVSEVMPLSRRRRAWLGALGALSGAGTIVVMCHPKWDYPVSTGLMVAVLVVVGLGRLFEQSWTYAFGIAGVLAAVLVGFFEMALGSGGLLPAFLLLAVLFSLAGRWSHYQWLRRPPAVRAVRREEMEEGDPQGPRRGRSLSDLRPRSRTAMMYACACLSVAAVLFGLGRHTNNEWLTVAVTMPEVILAVGLWLHADWVRWFGPLVCLGWAGLLAWFMTQPEFEGSWVIRLLPLVLLRLAWTFRRWQWEAPAA
jgi:hypothetical protein